MANWEQLDKAFYDVVNNLTDKQWQLWREQQEQNRIIRQKQKEMEMEMQLLQLSFLSFAGKSFLTEKSVESINCSNIENIEITNSLNKIEQFNTYAFAA